jgi:ABC-type multidrug transport system ATPase subunit
LISIKDLYKHFGHVQALNGLSMEVLPGDICGFLGPNGSGKSTTIRILLSLVKPEQGQVDIFGMDMLKSRKKILPKIGALIERPDFYEHLSAYTNLKLLLKYGGIELTENEILETLKIVGLKERAKDKVRVFSDGMKQRLGIAQAIIHKPELLILDEPFNGLDPQGVKDIRDLILKLNREARITVLISSHNLDEIEKLVNRLVLINKGKTVAEGTIDDLINKGASHVKLVVDDPEKAFLKIEQSAIKIEQLGMIDGNIFFSVNRKLIPQINNLLVESGIRVFHLSQDKSLESFFLTFMQSQ